MDKAQIIEAIEKMSILELAEFVKELEEKFGVSAAAAVVAAPGAAAGAAPAERSQVSVLKRRRLLSMALLLPSKRAFLRKTLTSSKLSSRKLALKSKLNNFAFDCLKGVAFCSSFFVCKMTMKMKGGLPRKIFVPYALTVMLVSVHTYKMS